KNQRETEAFYQINYEGTKNLCDAIDRLNSKPKAFIFISTVAVYGLEAGTLISEEAMLMGRSPYAHSKILAEEYLTKWTKKNNIKIDTLRLQLVAGTNTTGSLVDMIAEIKSIRYFRIGKAVSKKSMIWGADIVEKLPALIEKGGVYNLKDGHHPTFEELEAT